jgi:hypothetical protein
MNPKHPLGPPVTLGDMRELGVQNLIAFSEVSNIEQMHSGLRA